LTNASQWVLPGTPGAVIKRSPAYIIVDESQKVVWFTNPTSRQISRFNWSTNQLDDWDLTNLNIFPLDLVMKASNDIWFTALNDTRFFELKANTVFSYVILGMSPAGGQIPVAKPTRITLNSTCLFLTDFLHDKLYELPFPVLKALNFPLTHPGFSWDVDVDSANNVWVTQPLSSLIDEQLVHSVNKSYYRVNSTSVSITPETQFLQRTPLNVTVQIAPVTPSAYSGPLNITGDPYKVWSIPTGLGAVVTMVPPPARPWDVATSADGYAWFTEPFYNHVGVVQPNANRTLLYAVPTGQSLPLSMDIQPGNPSNSYHVWFTEYRSGQIGELFNASYTSTTPGAPLVITMPGIAVGFVAGAAAMGVIFLVARRSKK
jgi:hypothetical protein